MSQPRAARVILAYAQCKVLDPATGKPTMVGFYRDAVLPAVADPADVERLVRRGYAEWVDADPPAAPVQAPAPATEPAPADQPPPAKPPAKTTATGKPAEG